MKNFEIGKEINKILKQNNVLKVSNKIFPLIANPNTTFPFLVYRRIGFIPKNNKDYMGEMVTLELNIASETYNEAVEIANNVVDILQGKETEIIQDIRLLNISEIYLQDTYIENIQIQIELK